MGGGSHQRKRNPVMGRVLTAWPSLMEGPWLRVPIKSVGTKAATLAPDYLALIQTAVCSRIEGPLPAAMCDVGVCHDVGFATKRAHDGLRHGSRCHCRQLSLHCRHLPTQLCKGLIWAGR